MSCCRAKRGFERVGGDPARRPPRRGFLLQKLYEATFCSVSRRCKVGGSPGGTRRRRGHMRDARRAASLRATCAKGWREAYLIRELLRAEEASGRARNPEPGEHPQRVALERRTTREGGGRERKMPFIRAQSSDPRERRGRGKKSTRRLPTCKGPLRHKRAGPRFAHWAEAPFRLSPFTCFTLPPRSARLVPRLTLHYSKPLIAIDGRVYDLS